MITAAQCRAARALAALDQVDLASRAGVSLNTVRNFEAGHDIKVSTASKIRAALEGAGIVLIDANRKLAGGVALSARAPRRPMREIAKAAA